MNIHYRNHIKKHNPGEIRGGKLQIIKIPATQKKIYIYILKLVNYTYFSHNEEPPIAVC